MERPFIADLQVGMAVEGCFAVLDKYMGRQTARGRSPGKAYLRLLLGDRTGRIGAMLWERAEELGSSFSAGDAVEIRARVSEWNDRLQLELDSLRRVPPEQVDQSRLIPAGRRCREELEQELDAVRASITDPDLSRLLRHLLEEGELRERFITATAAVTVHHAYSGGLLEHSLEVVKWTELAVATFPDCAHRDLAVTGALLHDVGKLDAYLVDGTRFDMTLPGRLYGHLLLGCKLVADAIGQLEPFSRELCQELIHIIASHHGEQEYGAIETPRTFNAYCVHWADMASARLHQFAALIRDHPDPGRLWSRRDTYLGTEAYLGFLHGDQQQ